jgi:hypothetical protein
MHQKKFSEILGTPIFLEPALGVNPGQGTHPPVTSWPTLTTAESDLAWATIARTLEGDVKGQS